MPAAILRLALLGLILAAAACGGRCGPFDRGYPLCGL
jgi:hypothetical protein